MQLNWSIALSLCKLQQSHVTVNGHVVSQIGLTEVIWRKGCVDPNSVTLPNESESTHVSKKIPDFKDEPSEIELNLNYVGAEMGFAPKAHFELAIRGAKCIRGVSKFLFRKTNATLTTDQRTKDLKIREK